jgi:hypothetical protein
LNIRKDVAQQGHHLFQLAAVALQLGNVTPGEAPSTSPAMRLDVSQDVTILSARLRTYLTAVTNREAMVWDSWIPSSCTVSITVLFS